MRFVLSLICLLLLSVAGIDGAAPLPSAPAVPPKLSLGTSYVNLPDLSQPRPTQFVAPAPVKSLPPQTLPSETLPAQQGSTLSTRNLPIVRSETSETLAENTMAPLQPIKLQPNYRLLNINQEMIQPIYSLQPYLSVRHVTQNVFQPTLQKQPVIQPIITQPVLHRTIHNQPIIRQQLQQQNVVKRRMIAQPRVVQTLTSVYSTAPQQTQTEQGAAYETINVPNAKVAALSSASPAAPTPTPTPTPTSAAAPSRPRATPSPAADSDDDEDEE